MKRILILCFSILLVLTGCKTNTFKETEIKLTDTEIQDKLFEKITLKYNEDFKIQSYLAGGYAEIIGKENPKIFFISDKYPEETFIAELKNDICYDNYLERLFKDMISQYFKEDIEEILGENSCQLSLKGYTDENFDIDLDVKELLNNNDSYEIAGKIVFNKSIDSLEFQKKVEEIYNYFNNLNSSVYFSIKLINVDINTYPVMSDTLDITFKDFVFSELLLIKGRL